MTKPAFYQEDIERLIEARASNHRLSLAIRLLERRIDDCRRFYPWPALIQSYQQDIERLKLAKNGR